MARSEYAQGLVTKAVLYCLTVSEEPYATKCRQLEANAHARYSWKTGLAQAMFDITKNRLSSARALLLDLDRRVVFEPDFQAILAHYWFRVGSYTQALKSARIALESEKLSISLSRLMRMFQEKYKQCVVDSGNSQRRFFPLELDMEFCSQWELGLKESETSVNITLDNLIEIAGGKAMYDLSL